MSISLPTWTRREIPLRGRRSRVWAVFETGLRRGIRRPATIFAIGVSTAAATISSIVFALLAPVFLGGQPLDLSFFFMPASSAAIFFFVVLTAAVVGGGLIADDLDSMALTLYLSRPLTAVDYLTAKAAILATLTGLTAILPLVLTPILGALLGIFAWDVAAEAVGVGILLGALFTAVLAALSLFLSSLTRRRAYAAAAFSALIFGLAGTASLLASPGSVDNPALLYLSPWEDFLSVARAAYGVAPGPTEWPAALAILIGVTAVAALATWLRMRAMEVVTG